MRGTSHGIRAQRLFSALAWGLVAAFLAGCNGGGNPGTPGAPAQQPNGPSQPALSMPAGQTAKGTVTFAIAVKPKAKAPVRAPKYVSPSTQSLQILIDGGSPVVVNLSPSSPTCSPNPSVPGSYICRTSLDVAAGDHVFTLTTYDETGAKGNVLSTNSSGTVFVAPTGTTTVSVVLEGVVRYVILTLLPPNPVPGPAQKIPLTVVAEDADHNLIVGPASFDNPITLTSTDNSNGPLSKTALHSPAGEAGITANYDGSSSVASITYSATANGLPSANVTDAVLKPSFTPVVATSTGALSTLVIKGTVYAFVPTSSMSYPDSTGGLVEVPVYNGGGIITSALRHRNTARFHINPAHISPRILSARGARLPTVRRHPDYVNPVIAQTGGFTACAADQRHLRLYCIDASSTSISVLDASSVPAVVMKSIATDAAAPLFFSGGGCYICGVAYDLSDDAAIIGTANGIEVYSAAGTQISSTPANTSETFGYNPVTNQVFNPEYDGATGLPTPSIDVVDIPTHTRFTLTPAPGGLEEPDQGAVDSSTNVGISFEEDNSLGYYLVPMGSATFAASTTSFTVPNAVALPFNSGIENTCDLAADGIAIDSKIHVAFFNAEFCPGTVGAGQLPSATIASPTISSFAFAVLPATPDGFPFDSGFDPHAQSVFFGPTFDFGLNFNSDTTYLAVTDLKKLLAAPRAAGDPTLIDPSYDLIANKVVTYIPI